MQAAGSIAYFFFFFCVRLILPTHNIITTVGLVTTDETRIKPQC